MKGEISSIRSRKDGESLFEYYRAESGVDLATVSAEKTAWRTYTDWAEDNNLELGEVNKKEVKEFKSFLLKEYNNSTPASYFSRVDGIISWLNRTEEADYNPFDHVDAPKRKDDTSKIDVNLDDLRDAILEVKSESIELFVYIMVALKTGLRSSEIVNLDLRDVHLDHPISKAMPDPRKELYNHPDTLYVDSTISKEEVHNGEKRTDGNKENSTRKVPIDRELKSVLVWWIAMQPPSESPANPLMQRVKDPVGGRYSGHSMRIRVTEWARRNNLNSADMKHFGVDSHWCRHWFSTTLRARIDDDEVTLGSAKGYVEGLRGDSEDSTIDTYTHEWDEVREKDDKEYREVYEENVPMLLVDSKEDQGD